MYTEAILQFFLFTSEDDVDPGEVFWDFCVDAGFGWGIMVIVTAGFIVERHDTNSLSVAHQRTTRIILRGEKYNINMFCNIFVVTLNEEGKKKVLGLSLNLDQHQKLMASTLGQDSASIKVSWTSVK